MATSEAEMSEEKWQNLPPGYPSDDARESFRQDLEKSASEILQLRSPDMRKIATFLNLANSLPFVCQMDKCLWVSKCSFSKEDLEKFENEKIAEHDRTTWNDGFLRELKSFATVVTTDTKELSRELEKLPLPLLTELTNRVHLCKVFEQLNHAINAIGQARDVDMKVMLSSLTIGTVILNIADKHRCKDFTEETVKKVKKARITLTHFPSVLFTKFYYLPDNFSQETLAIVNAEQSIHGKMNESNAETVSYLEGDDLNRLCEAIDKLFEKLQTVVKQDKKKAITGPAQGNRYNKKKQEEEGSWDLSKVFIKVLIRIRKLNDKLGKTPDNYALSKTGFVKKKLAKEEESKELIIFFQCKEFRDYQNNPRSDEQLGSVRAVFCTKFSLSEVDFRKKYDELSSEQEPAKQECDLSAVKEQREKQILTTTTGSYVKIKPEDEVFDVACDILQAHFADHDNQSLKVSDLKPMTDQLCADVLLKMSCQFLIAFVGSVFQTLQKQADSKGNPLLSTDHDDYRIHWYAVKMRNELFHASRVHQSIGIFIRKYSSLILKLRGANDDDESDTVETADYKTSCCELARFIYIFTQFRNISWPRD